VVVDVLEHGHPPRRSQQRAGSRERAAVGGGEGAAVDGESHDRVHHRGGRDEHRSLERGQVVVQGLELPRRHQHGAHAVRGPEQAADDQRALGDEQAGPAPQLDAAPECRVGQPDVVGDARVGGVLDGDDGHPGMMPAVLCSAHHARTREP
jgi:hypothetical protein